MRLDAIGKQVLNALIDDPDASSAAISDRTGATQEVVEDRLGRLRMGGILLGRSVRLDAEAAGFPFEALVMGAPSEKTERNDLLDLADAPLVGRLFALAAHQSIAFTVFGADVDDVTGRADTLAQQVGLEDVSTTLIVGTMADDPAGGIRRAWRNSHVRESDFVRSEPPTSH